MSKYTVDTYAAAWDDAIACHGGGLEAGDEIRMPTPSQPDAREFRAFERRLNEAGLIAEYEYEDGDYDVYTLVERQPHHTGWVVD